MPSYRIERRFDAAITPEEAMAATYRAASCLRRFPGLTWIRSYWDDAAKVSTCLYSTDDPDLIYQHAAAAQIPADEVHEVIEVDPAAFAD